MWLANQKLKEITNLDKKVNSNDLMYKHKGNTAHAKFDQFDNAFGLLDKMRGGKTSLAVTKNYQAEFISNLSEIKKEA